MRLQGVYVALFLAVGALAAATLPLLARHHETAAPNGFAGTTSVFAFPLAGGAPHRVLQLDGQWAYPVATADGKALLLETPGAMLTTIWRVPLDGSKPRQIATTPVFTGQFEDAGPFSATEVPDAPRVELVVKRAGSIVWQRKIAWPVGAASVSADGRSVAQIRQDVLELWSRAGHRVLARDAVGSSPPVWTRDGRSLVYAASANRIVVRSIASGRVRTIARGLYVQPTLSRDGRTLYAVRLNAAVSIPK